MPFLETLLATLVGAVVGSFAAWLFALDLRRRARREVSHERMTRHFGRTATLRIAESSRSACAVCSLVKRCMIPVSTVPSTAPRSAKMPATITVSIAPEYVSVRRTRPVRTADLDPRRSMRSA